MSNPLRRIVVFCGSSTGKDPSYAEAAKSLGKEYDEEMGEKIKEALTEEAEAKASAWYSTSQTWDDGVIDPRETRNYLGICLAVLYNQKIKGAESYGVWRMQGGSVNVWYDLDRRRNCLTPVIKNL